MIQSVFMYILCIVYLRRIQFMIDIGTQFINYRRIMFAFDTLEMFYGMIMR